MITKRASQKVTALSVMAMLMTSMITVVSPSGVIVSPLSFINPSPILTAISNLAQSIDARFLNLINPSSIFTTLSAYAEAMITTDKAEYTQGETVTIIGSGFLPSTTITLTITHPDFNIVTWNATSDDAGSFTTTYTLDAFAETYTVTATDGTNTATTTFTDPPPPPTFSIKGTKFNDDDSSGTINMGDTKVSGWTIVLYASGSTTLTSTTTTGGGGGYTFSGLSAGTYDVCEEIQDAIQILPASGVDCSVKTPPAGKTLAPFGYSITVGPDANDKDFLNAGVGLGGGLDFTQCENDSSNTNTKNNCNWVTGGLNQNNAFYTEGDVVPQRLFHNIDTAGTHTMRFAYDFSQANIYAYDFASTPTITQSGALLAQCDDLPGFVSGATCSSMFSGATSASIPSDPFDAVPSRENPASRTWLVGGSSSISGVSIAFGTTVADGEALEDHNPDTDPDCFQTCGSSSVIIEVTFTTSAANTIVGLWMGLHLAQAADPDGGGPLLGWGTGFGSSSVSGAPFHYKYTKLDGASVGNRDNQIQSSGVVTPGTIIIKKNAIPNGPTNFNFTSTIPSVPTFKLNDTGDNVGNMTMFSVAPGTYNVIENDPSPANFALTALICSDPTSNTTTNLAQRNATINVASSETVTCTYTNTKAGTIKIIKDTVPNGPHDFNYTTTGGLSPATFSLDDDADGTLSNMRQYDNVTPGNYTVTEAAATGFATLLICTDTTGGSTPSSSTATSIANIDLDAGDTVTCTYTNTQTGTIIIKKTAYLVNPAGTRSVDTTTKFTFDPDGFSNTNFMITGGQMQTFNSVAPSTDGSYMVTEVNLPLGASLNSITCTETVTTDSTISLSTKKVTIKLQPGETITCTYTDTILTGIINIKKVTNPSTDTTTMFTFTPAGFSSTAFSLKNGQTKTYNIVAPSTDGSYMVTETVLTGWSLTGLTCTENKIVDSIISLATKKVTIKLQPGETITCTFTDKKL